LTAIFSEPGSSSQHGKPFLLKRNLIRKLKQKLCEADVVQYIKKIHVVRSSVSDWMASALDVDRANLAVFPLLFKCNKRHE